jgi:hypothetical protein
MRQEAGTHEVRKLGIRTSGDNPQGPAPLDSGPHFWDSAGQGTFKATIPSRSLQPEIAAP